MAQMVKYMVCIIYRWYRWLNIWFASYIDSLDGQIYGLHHTQMAQMVKYMRTIIESLLAFSKKNLFFCNSVPKRPAVNMMRVTREHCLSRSGALLVA